MLILIEMIFLYIDLQRDKVVERTQSIFFLSLCPTKINLSVSCYVITVHINILD